MCVYYFAASSPGGVQIVVMSRPMSVRLSVCSHISKTVWPNFTTVLCMLSVAVGRFSSDSVVIRYVLPVLRMTSCCRAMGFIGGRTGTALCIALRHQWSWSLSANGDTGFLCRAGRVWL